MVKVDRRGLVVTRKDHKRVDENSSLRWFVIEWVGLVALHKRGVMIACLWCFVTEGVSIKREGGSSWNFEFGFSILVIFSAILLLIRD